MHAVLSPSGAHRWMHCAGSAALEGSVPSTSSVYADEGTAAHILAGMVLIGTCPASDFLGEVIHVGERKFTVTKAMAEYVQSYCDFVREKATGCQLFVEQKAPIGHITGEPGATGTADAIIVDAVGRRLIMVDFKYGMGVRVHAQRNPQTRFYGLGSADKFDYLSEYDEVEMIIHQPRLNHISTEVVSMEEMLEFADEAAICAEQAHLAIDLFNAGAMPEELDLNGYLNPSEDACRFCNAKSICPALRREVVETCSAGAAKASDFASLFPIIPDAELDADVLAVSMGKVELIEDWCKGIRAEVDRRMLAGQEVPGFKVVIGKQGNRAWLDERAAEKALKAAKLGASVMYEKKLVSPTTAEKLLKKNNPVAWEKMQNVITRAPGKPSVAPVTDPRPALAIVNVAEAFRELT
jgi:hypothetical protein